MKGLNRISIFALISIHLGCKHHATPPQDDATAKWKSAVGTNNFHLLMSAIEAEAKIPQCTPQKNASSQQLAPSYFENMKACHVVLPPQFNSSEGTVDEKGDCNLGIADSTELVCHYHSSYEFAFRSKVPERSKNIVEIHCVTFKLDSESKRLPTPMVYGMQLTCADGTMPATEHENASESHAKKKMCGSQFGSFFEYLNSCQLDCCQDGTLTNEKVDMKIRPSFAICPAQQKEVNCADILSNLHAHTPHRPHDKVGAKYQTLKN